MSDLLHSKILGSGEPLVVLHGFLGMSDNWKTLGSKYSENGFEVHLVDQRNHGRSFHSEDFNYDFLAADLKTYLDYHQIEKASIIGHSMGGKTAMQFACDFPNLTEKLVVADISPKYYPPHHNEIINGLNALNFELIPSRSQADQELAKHIAEHGTRQFLLKNLYWVEKGQLGFRFNLEVLSTKMEEIGENISAISNYDGPTLFLKGDKSEYVVAADLPEIKIHFPNAELDTIENAGHWLHAENPKQFFEKSIAFLNS
ncbi:alpha/beta fold hydrolase [Maribacter algarum]|uniref:Alpha/beta fold hydrolase n=1 Tax=Maribacter algarum (ex Zhang et al. 2020) TaxID=2578118 RepID=A0A5S3PT57_9FLAO|nr:alpha/beta fold hydrolase [Maribacter algarum]TMM58176.1 alpha/beta fold hydrolase [Maribacter algarum]